MPSISRRKLLLGTAALAGMWTMQRLWPSALGVVKDISRQVQPLMGTWVQIDVRHASANLREQALATAFSEAGRLAALLTHYDSAAPLGQLHAAGKLTETPPELCLVLASALEMNALTQGVPEAGFNPAITPLFNALEYYGAPGPQALPPGELRNVRRLCNAKNVRLADSTITLGSQEMRLTLDGIAKGYVVDAIAKILENCGISNYLVNAGGDLRVLGEQAAGQAWVVGIQHGLQPNRLVQRVEMRMGALASSGNSQRFANNLPPHLVASEAFTGVSVWAATAMRADALATALFTLPKALGQSLLFGERALWQSQEA